MVLLKEILQDLPRARREGVPPTFPNGSPKHRLEIIRVQFGIGASEKTTKIPDLLFVSFCDGRPQRAKGAKPLPSGLEQWNITFVNGSAYQELERTAGLKGALDVTAFMNELLGDHLILEPLKREADDLVRRRKRSPRTRWLLDIAPQDVGAFQHGQPALIPDRQRLERGIYEGAGIVEWNVISLPLDHHTR
jgi:hypothetical protein